MKYSTLIRKHRKQAGLTQQELANACGVSRITVGYWEAGRNDPSKGNMQTMGRLIGLPNQTEREPKWLSAFTRSASLWSNPDKKNEPSLLAARLARANFIDLVELCQLHSISKVKSELESIREEMKPMQYSTEKNMLENISKGLTRA